MMSKELRGKLEKSFMTLEPLAPQYADEIDLLLNGGTPPNWPAAYRKLFTNEGLHYTPWQQAVFFTALQTKGFVILSGISGTGKTKIAQAFSAALPQPADGRNVEFLTVRPDWRDSKSLLGYHNPITDRYEWTPFLRFLLRASESWESGDGLAWFVILDEMNLAHVEHYFAELLSLLESGRDRDGWTREAIQLPSNGDADSPPASLKLPPNLHIIGTVNLDETTHAFSPKVLDRAFAMELVEVSFSGFPFATANGASLDEQEQTALLDAFSINGTFPRIEHGTIVERIQQDARPRDWLESLNQQLRPAYMHFGYRVFDEILAFVDLGMKNGLFNALGPGGDPLFAPFDAAVQMKVLPKFHGSRAKLEDPLIRVLGWCLDPLNPDTTTIRQVVAQAMTAEAMEAMLQQLPYHFPHTAHRAIRLLWTAQVDGFAAFG
jgi:5-methylcytosine-specific restriction endonuclease McrBC GTP-binding regulatory subunit McrB